MNGGDRRAEELAAHVERALADAPPLTEDQKRTIARLLAPEPPAIPRLVSQPLTVRIKR